jgi:natural product biosynthesis luciferase-like monooxygenase protein
LLSEPNYVLEGAATIVGNQLKDLPAGSYPLSFAQQRLWVIHEMDPEVPLYNESFAYRLKGPLEAEAFAACLRIMVKRHASFRTVFQSIDGMPIQRIHPALDVPLAQVDLRTMPEAEREGEAMRSATAEARKPFDLTAGPLLRLTLFRLSDDDHLLVVVVHHAIWDAWSGSRFFQELSLLYSGCVTGTTPELPELPMQYHDYAVWQREWLEGGALQEQLAYWKQALNGDVSPVLLPTDRPRTATVAPAGARHQFVLPPSLIMSLKALSRQEGVTLYMTLLAAFKTLLYRYSGQADIVVGTPIAGRSRVEHEGLIGFFVNMLPLRTQFDQNPTFKGLLRQVRGTTLDAFAHQDLPFEKLLKELNLERTLSHAPLLQVVFSYRNAMQEDWTLHGLAVSSVELHNGTAKFDLTLDMVEKPGGVVARLEYNSDLFDAETVERMVTHFQTLLEAFVRNPGARVADLPLLTIGESLQLSAWNDTKTEYATHLCAHHLIEAQVAATPNAIALVCQGAALTYKELNGRANQLARRLQRGGLNPDQRVAICMDRSLEMVVAMLAVLKAGGAYVPLDPSYPPDRLAFMLSDAGVSALLTLQNRASTIMWPEQGPVLCLDSDWESIACEEDDNPDADLRPDHLAYVIYTSGSTGRPKGVMVSHRNVVNFFKGMDDRVGCGATDTLFAVTSISFDISVLELLWTLARGAKVVLASKESLLNPASSGGTRAMAFSLFYFASAEDGQSTDKYRLLIEGAKFADQNGFAAVWTPERHFHSFGGLYPNPSVAGAALAMVTERVEIRAGSVVLPLHNPIRVAEEWSVVDNLSRGRVGVAFASGWHADDFVFAPDHYRDRKETLLRNIQIVQDLWQGESVTVQGGAGNQVSVRLYPHPVQKRLPVWLTCAGNPDTFTEAGRLGANVLTHLLGQSPEELAAKIALYRESRRRHGHDPNAGRVALMLHTFVGTDREQVLATVRKPLTEYLRASVGLIENLARSLGHADVQNISPDDMEDLLAHAFDRYVNTSALIGTPENCLEMVERLKDIGVDEVASLIDFGVDQETVLQTLPHLDDLRRRASAQPVDYSLQADMERHDVSMLQCTPSLMRILLSGGGLGVAQDRLRVLMLGGEALPVALSQELTRTLRARVINMYGPTETTVWSATHELAEASETVPIGRPISNTQIHILDSRLMPVPIGVVGELYIGGLSVTRGYLGRPELTAERFIPDPFSRARGVRLFRTGDLARYRQDGTIEFLGRADLQVKIRGHRIELGEIETALLRHPQLREAAVVATEDGAGNKSLVAYVTAAAGYRLQPADVRAFLKERLPDFMVPSAVVSLDALPMTSNGKVDRLRLPSLHTVGSMHTESYAPPQTAVEQKLASIWSAVLGVEHVGVNDNFVELGGDSITAIQVIARANQVGLGLSFKLLFRHQTIAELAAMLPGQVPAAGEPSKTEPGGLPTNREPVTPGYTPADFPVAKLSQQTLSKILKKLK